MSIQTLRAVTRHLAALKQSGYEIGVRPDQGAFIMHEWQADKVIENIPWLRHRNALGDHIYVRPQAPLPKSNPVIFLDDLDRKSVNRMEADGIHPLAVVETSPFNLQAWIQIANNPIEPDVATAAATVLALKYGGDLNSADWRHFGRLAGFTNRKKKYQNPTTGHFPFVKLRSASTSHVISEFVLDDAVHYLANQELKKAKRHHKASISSIDLKSPGQIYKAYASAILRRFAEKTWSKDPDWSRMDWMVGNDILANGIDPSILRQAILEGSPNLEERHRGRVHKYVDHTIKKLLETV